MRYPYPSRRAGGNLAHMDELLLPLAVLGLWFLLQAVILPRLGVPT